MRAGDKWVDQNAGPVVRPYALTGGRTEPASGEVLDLIAVVVASAHSTLGDDLAGLPPEHRQILGLCRGQVTLADVASAMSLPVGVVRVLLADLIQQGRIGVISRHRPGEERGTDLLEEVLQGLQAL